jgi:hypothetical protein
MAAEKVTALLFHIDQMLEFFEEYEVKPDEEVKKELSPKLEALRKWLDEKPL